MTFRIAASLAFALVFAPAVRPAAAQVLASPTVESLRASMLASDSILVARVEVEENVTTDSAGQAHTSIGQKRVAVNNVKNAWIRRFAASFLTDGMPLRPELCPAPTSRGGLARPWVLSALWINKTGRGQAYVNLLTGCGIVGLQGGRPASLDIGAHTDSLLALFQQVLYADSALATVKARSLPDTTRAKPQAASAALETLPEAIDRVPPAYPDSARNASSEGTVIVKALVGSNGLVQKAEIQTSVPGLDEAALAAVKQWHFRPATAAGKPIAVWVSVPVNFNLRPRSPHGMPPH